MQVATNVVTATISAVIIRADGTVEDLGVIDSYQKPEPEEKKD